VKLFNMQSAVTIFVRKFLKHQYNAEIDYDLCTVPFAPLQSVVQRVRQITHASAPTRRR